MTFFNCCYEKEKYSTLALSLLFIILYKLKKSTILYLGNVLLRKLLQLFIHFFYNYIDPFIYSDLFCYIWYTSIAYKLVGFDNECA